MLKMYVNSSQIALKKAHFYNVVGKEAATLLYYEFLYRYFSDILFKLPEHLLVRLPLNGSEHLSVCLS